MIDLCAVGNLNWLIVLSMSFQPLAEKETPVHSVERLLGNDAAIVSLLAARLGLRCLLLPTNAISSHDGQPLITVLECAGVDISHIDSSRTTTPITFVLSRADPVERTLLAESYTFRDFSTWQLPVTRFACIDFYEGHIKEHLALLQKWSQTGSRCLVNLSSFHVEEKARLLASSPDIDVVQIGGSGGVDEAFLLASHIRRVCNPKAVVITLGALGVVVVDRYNQHYIPAEPVQPLRTVGAGASFTAGFLSALMQAASYKDAAIFANTYAADFCTQKENPLNA